MPTITRVEAIDVRFPTSRFLDGSDAMNPDPDYSAAYCILHTTEADLKGFGLTFTIGRGTELCVAAINALAGMVTGTDLDELASDPGALARRLTWDSQFRWLGPEKGIVHLAAAAVINAAWDLMARRAELPLWRYLLTMSDDAIARAIDYRHIDDALSPQDVMGMLAKNRAHRPTREQKLLEEGHAAYTTSAGWLGYPDDKIRTLATQAAAEGWRAIKVKVGRDLEDDMRRLRTLRILLGKDFRLMIDANQVWGVTQAITWVKALAPFDPWWIEEPVSPDDILGHRRIKEAVLPVRVATGEHCHNRVMFKQFLQADALDVVQLDACRLAGVNEVLAVLFLAAKFGKPVCPHAGGVGLCEYVQHVSFFDEIALSGPSPERMIEHAGHLHEHFTDPIRMHRGRYLAPAQPGFSVQLKEDSIAAFRYPEGTAWLS